MARGRSRTLANMTMRALPSVFAALLQFDKCPGGLLLRALFLVLRDRGLELNHPARYDRLFC